MNVTSLNPAARGTRPTKRSNAVRWGGELGLIAVLYAAYLAGRSAIGVHTGAAVRRGQQILDVEAIVGLDIEQPLNALTMAVPPVALLFAYLYATLHYVATPVALVWIAVRRKEGYRRARNGLLVATACGLLGYWLLPTAPPRLLDAGFTDVMAAFSGVGWWGDAASAPRGMEALSNQFAAFPSLHVGWAMWVALALRANVRRRVVRRWVFGYPVLMSVVVMATANHYLVDALAGVACAALGHWVAGCWEARARSVAGPSQAGGRGVAPAGIIEPWAEQEEALAA